MIGIEEKIWAETFSAEVQNAIVKKYPIAAPLIAACWQVKIFRAGDMTVPQPSLEEAMAMYNELRGTVESERLSIQKELLGAVIQRLEDRIKQLRASARVDDFSKLQNGEKAGELQYLVNEFRRTLG